MNRPRRYTREVVTNLEAKVAVKIEAEDNTNVVLSDEALGYALTLDPRAANQLGQVLIQAARLTAMNTLDPAPTHSEVTP